MLWSNVLREDEYDKRLADIKLMSLEMRRLRSDLIDVFKIMHNLEGLRRDDFFLMRHLDLRGHICAICKQHSRLNC